MLMPDGAQGTFFMLSLVPKMTPSSALELIAYVLFGFLVVRALRNRKQIFAFVLTLIVIGIFEAAYGMFELYNKTPNILFFKKRYGLTDVTGTFVNRNHLSGFLEMIIPLAIGFVIARLDLFTLSKMKWREKIVRLSEKGMAGNILLTFGIAVMALGILFSKSRSGVFLLIMSFILFFEMSVFYVGKTRKRKTDARRFIGAVFLLLRHDRHRQHAYPLHHRF
jgi:hypothetical protein